jgi:hypothetical protein
VRRRRRPAELVATLCAVVAGVLPLGGCGSHSPAARSPTRIAGDGTWLTDLAHAQAVELGDRSPRREVITLGHPDVIELWGNFVCGKSCYLQTGAAPPRGNYVRITVDPRTRSIDGFALKTLDKISGP